MASLPHRRIVEQVHGQHDNITESIAQRIIRLRRDIPQTVDTILSMSQVPLEAANGDPILERKESALADASNPFAKMHQQLESSLDDTGMTLQRYMLNNYEMQHQTFGPSDAQVALCDPFRAPEYIPFRAVKYQMEQASNSAEHTDPVLVIDNISALHALSWDMCSAKYGEVSTRLEDLERQVGVTDGITDDEDDSTQLGLMAQVTNLEQRLQLATSDYKMNSLTRRIAVLSSEIDVLVGRGMPKEDVNDTPSETNFSELHTLTEECGWYFEEFENMLPALMQLEDTYRETLSLLTHIQACEDKQRQVKALTEDASVIINNVKRSHTQAENMRTGKQTVDASPVAEDTKDEHALGRSSTAATATTNTATTNNTATTTNTATTNNTATTTNTATT
eukprot:Lankesteria_metandrocarpae@DN10649_c0_g1_i1.p1